MKKIIYSTFFSLIPMHCFASSGGGDLPIVVYLQGLVSDLTGPIPLTLGAIGLSLAAISMFGNSRSEGFQRMLGVFFGVGIALMIPQIVQMISGCTI